MPFKSAKQRRFMYATVPKVAKRWTAEAKAKKAGGKKGKKK